MLKRTGLALVLVVDDERFAQQKAELAKRIRARNREMLPAGSMKLLKGKITPKISKKMQLLRTQKLSPQQRRRIAKHAAKARWRRKAASGALIGPPLVTPSAHGQPTSSLGTDCCPPMGDQAAL
jgi:hypothetical protein